MPHYLLRFGIMGNVALFATDTPVVYRRKDRVICRTERGLETAVVVTMAEPSSESVESSNENSVFEVVAGTILRHESGQDRLLSQRIEKNRIAAIEECSKKIASLNLDVVLIDAELLFDGSSLFFYFLGEPSEEFATVSQALAETYDSQIQFRKFTEAVSKGCGTDCGTKESSGCSTGGCGSCAIAGACGSK